MAPLPEEDPGLPLQQDEHLPGLRTLGHEPVLGLEGEVLGVGRQPVQHLVGEILEDGEPPEVVQGRRRIEGLEHGGASHQSWVRSTKHHPQVSPGSMERAMG
jgi:hypothetical protein